MACLMLRAATEPSLIGSLILPISLIVLSILMPILSVHSEILTIASTVLAVCSEILPIALNILTVVPHLLPVLLELSSARSRMFISQQLLAVVTQGPIVLSHILTV